MTAFASAADRARRTAGAADAAVAAGRGLGLDVAGADLVHDVFSVVVRLHPAPVVARIPVVVPSSGGTAALQRRQRDELAVAAWLDGRGVPVLKPSPLVPAEPVEQDGFSMTFWEFAEEDRSAAPDYAANAESVAGLHAELRRYPGRLGFLSAADPDFVTEAFAELAGHPDLIGAQELDRARREWRVLEPLVRSPEAFAARFPGVQVQPVHGDSPVANVFAGAAGPRFADFELVSRGPVEWDLAGLGPDLEAAYNRGATARGLRPLDPDVLAFVNAVGVLRGLATLSLAPQLPAVVGFIAPVFSEWAGMPFAGGLAG
ncbi:aminoglycoside phosphotransferase/kinase family protein [Nocardiopsis coralliicola]